MSLKKGEAKRRKPVRHGLSYHPVFDAYNNMLNRCYNKTNPGYDNYGGRGITVCQEWLGEVRRFYDWALANGWVQGLELDRKEVNGNYEPSNCRWVTKWVQQRNRRSNRLITYNGVTKTLVEWSEITGIKYHTLEQRLNKRNWPIDKLFINPKNGNSIK